jgi:succinoglycan biosynthesis transport protein ExoP
MDITAHRSDDASGAFSLLRAVRRRLGIVLLCVVLLPAAALTFSQLEAKQYSASASLLFRDPQLDQKLFGSTVFAPSTDPTREAATNVKLVSLDTVAARTAKRLPGGMTASEVQSKVEVSSEGASDVASIVATDTDPQFAAKLANTFAQEFIAFRREADRSKISSARQLVQQQLNRLDPEQRNGEQGRSLRTQSEQLSILAALQTGNAELVQPASVPTSASSPKPVRNTILGLVLGLLMGVGLAVLLERIDRRLRTPAEIGATFGRPVLGAVPDSRSIAKNVSALDGLEPAEAEAFRMLRANLRYFNVDREVRSVLITSSAPGEGKSTVAVHLARTAAASGARVLLLEADLRRPTLAGRLGISGGEGISQVLAGTRDLPRAIRHVHLSEAGDNGPMLDVLTAGPIPPNPSDLIESEQMRKIIRGAEEAYDLVIIDTPPTSVVSDAIPLVSEVSGVIAVARLGKTTRESAAHLRAQFENLGANLLGVVVNSVGRRSAGYGYGYGYGYEPADSGAKDRKSKREKSVANVRESAGRTDTTNTFVAATQRASGRSRADAPEHTNGTSNGEDRPRVRAGSAPSAKTEAFSDRLRRRLGG